MIFAQRSDIVRTCIAHTRSTDILRCTRRHTHAHGSMSICTPLRVSNPIIYTLYFREISTMRSLVLVITLAVVFMNVETGKSLPTPPVRPPVRSSARPSARPSTSWVPDSTMRKDLKAYLVSWSPSLLAILELVLIHVTCMLALE